jgi:UDP-N-acetylglucosamine:LPS N-acetylglucosamine transferase
VTTNFERRKSVVWKMLKSSQRKKIFAIASGGGHWVQLLRLRPAFEGHALHLATTVKGLDYNLKGTPVHIIRDGSRWDRRGTVIMVLQLFWLLLKLRPDVIITTGAAPGVAAIAIGKLIGARCVWLDSIANASELSLSGRLVAHMADLRLTQWPDLAKDGGPYYRGAVL